MYPTDVIISQTLPKSRMMTLMQTYLVAQQIANAGFRKPEVVVYTPQGNQTADMAVANGHVNLSDKYPFHFIWLDEDGEPISMEGVESAAFVPVRGRPTEFLSRLLKSPIGQKVFGPVQGTEADVWAFIRSAAQTPQAQPKYANLMSAVVNTLDNIIGS